MTMRDPATLIASGKGPFDQSTAVEMLDAVKALEHQLSGITLPASVNFSLGTHVGPHNGESPLEEYIAQKLFKKCDRFLIASAGNNGGKGLSAKRVLEANESETLCLRIGSRCKKLLVEFWWDDSNPANLNIDAEIWEPQSLGGSSHFGTVSIGPGLVGSVLTRAPAGLPKSMDSFSLISAKCQNNYGCIAFAISTSQAALPILEIKFTQKSTIAIVVNGWIVVCESDPLTAFVEGGQEGTIMVPASNSAVVSVAGVKSDGQMWDGSSRGPAAQYTLARPSKSSPFIAHLAELGSEFGTSVSSPRACGDVTRVMIDPARRARCIDAIDLVCETYGLVKPPASWNVRSGYSKQTK